MEKVKFIAKENIPIELETIMLRTVSHSLWCCCGMCRTAIIERFVRIPSAFLSGKDDVLVTSRKGFVNNNNHEMVTIQTICVYAPWRYLQR